MTMLRADAWSICAEQCQPHMQNTDAEYGLTQMHGARRLILTHLNAHAKNGQQGRDV